MSTSKASKLIVEFEDGSRAEARAGEVSAVLWDEVLRQPFASRPSARPQQEKYVLVEWQDGWKEVVAVPGDCQEINRYRVLVRPEEVGRLSLNRGDGYPELVEIHRRPNQVQRVTFADSYSLEQVNTLREGKKRELHFALRKEGDRLGTLKAEVEQALQRAGVGPEVFNGQDGAPGADSGAAVCRAVGLAASVRQQDLRDFLGGLFNEE